MAVTTLDELNVLGIKRKSMPYEQFFGEMDLPEEEKKRRQELAEQFEVIFLLMFALYWNEHTVEELKAIIYEQYLTIATAHIGASIPTAYITDHAAKIAEETVNVTEDRAEEDVYWTSEDRAIYIAENEANSVGNYEELMDAIANGMTLKTWVTMNDNRVRPTHKNVNFVTIDILEPFEVGDSQMMFPRDDSLGASSDEIAGCRCVAHYS